MTHTLVFDTETTGLPPKGNNALTAQPYLLQIAAVLYRDEDRWPVMHFSTYVDPYTISPSGMLHEGQFPDSDFHRENKLTPAYCADVMMRPNTALAMFRAMCQRSSRIVAHNLAFDAPRIADTCERLEVPFDFFPAVRICTMETLTPVMKLRGKFPGKYKWPNLAEAYRAYVNPEGFSNAHDAMNDVQACASVLFACEDQGIPLHIAAK